jgi:hypothetical protein
LKLYLILLASISCVGCVSTQEPTRPFNDNPMGEVYWEREGWQRAKLSELYFDYELDQDFDHVWNTEVSIEVRKMLEKRAIIAYEKRDE